MDAREWLRRAAEGKPLPEDPIGNAAVEIMDRIVKNLEMEIPTHDIQHHVDIEEIIRRLIPNFSEKYSMAPKPEDFRTDETYCAGFNDALKLVDAHFSPDENDYNSH